MKFGRADLVIRVAMGIAAIVALIGGSASAVTPELLPAPGPAPASTWTGFYLGGNLG
jgi:hypothetical protein